MSSREGLGARRLKVKLEAKFFGEYYRKWAVSPILAMDGATPKAAVKDERLRPKLVEILKDMINMERNSPALHIPMIFDALGIRPEDLGLEAG